jgi:hypothetical protein
MDETSEAIVSFSQLHDAEENMIKVFLNSSDSTNSSSSYRNILIYVLSFCNIVTPIGNTIINYYLYCNMSSEISKETPHIKSIF